MKEKDTTMIKSLKLSKILKLSVISASVLMMSASCSTVLDVLKSIQQPQVSIKSFSYSEADFQHIGFKLALDVNNPNAIGIKTSDINYNLDISQKNLIGGNLNNGLEIAAQKTSTIEIPISVNFQKLIEVIPGIFSNANNLDYKVYGIVNFDTAIGKLPINWQKADKIDLQQIISIPGLFTGQK